MLDIIKLSGGDKVAVIGGWCDVLSNAFSGMGAEVLCLEGGSDLSQHARYLRSAKLIVVLGLRKRAASNAIEYVARLNISNALLITDAPANKLSPAHTVVILGEGERITLYVYKLSQA